MTLSSSEILTEVGYGGISNRLIREWTAHNGGNIFLCLDDERGILRSLYRAFLLLFLGAILMVAVQYLADSPASWELVFFILVSVALVAVAVASIWNVFYLVKKLISYKHSAKVGKMFGEDHSNLLILFGKTEPRAVAEWTEFQGLARCALTKKAQDLDDAEKSYKVGGDTLGLEEVKKAGEEFEEAFELLCRFRLIEYSGGRGPFFQAVKRNNTVSLTTVPSS